MFRLIYMFYSLIYDDFCLKREILQNINLGIWFIYYRLNNDNFIHDHVITFIFILRELYLVYSRNNGLENWLWQAVYIHIYIPFLIKWPVYLQIDYVYIISTRIAKTKSEETSLYEICTWLFDWLIACLISNWLHYVYIRGLDIHPTLPKYNAFPICFFSFQHKV